MTNSIVLNFAEMSKELDAEKIIKCPKIKNQKYYMSRNNWLWLTYMRLWVQILANDNRP